MDELIKLKVSKEDKKLIKDQAAKNRLSVSADARSQLIKNIINEEVAN